MFAKWLWVQNLKLNHSGNGGNIYTKNDQWKGIAVRYARAGITNSCSAWSFPSRVWSSDREIADNANKHASVTQALTLLNGTFYGAVFNKESPLMKTL